jgi:hypothetical protein
LNASLEPDKELHIGSTVETDFPPVTQFLLAKFLSNGQFAEVERLVRTKFDLISKGDYGWLRDLKEIGTTDEDIVKSLRETVEPVPWISSFDESPERTPGPILEGQILPDFHQLNCVHLGISNTVIEPPLEHGLQPAPKDWSFEPDKAERLRRSVANCCGLAGIFPPDSPMFEYGYARFKTYSGSTVQIGFGVSDMEWIDLSALPAVHADLVHQIWVATRCACSAVRVLQDSGFCCDRLTMLVPNQERPADAVDMCPIHLKDADKYAKDLQNLWNEMQIRKRWSIPLESLRVCVASAMVILKPLALDDSKLRDKTSQDEASQLLNICALTTQLLSFILLSYSQAHVGDLWPFFLREPLQDVILLGCRVGAGSGFVVLVSYHQLACMGDLLGDKIIVMQAIEISSYASRLLGSRQGLVLVASIEDIIDSWGPGLLISDPAVKYGEGIHAVRIGGGAIAKAFAPPGSSVTDRWRAYHWSRLQETKLDDLDTFNIWQPLKIGAVSVQATCAIDSQQCRKESECYLVNLGTEADHWKLVDRQLSFQVGQYVGLQVGNVYSKIKGKSLKTVLLDNWRIMPDFRLLLQPWGLQVSLCTGVARRVPLKDLIQEPMFAYIDCQSPKGWGALKTEMRSAFSGAIDYIEWLTGLQGAERDCAIKVITFFLEILKDTGLDREGNELRMLWPHESSLSHAISLRCNKCNLWARVLKDSPSCATFAAVTSTCLEAPGYRCKKNPAPTWTGQGALLATAVCRVSIPGAMSMSGTSHWELKNGQQCWIERAGGEIWVYTTKRPDSDTQLRVKLNRFPKGLSLFREWQILREKQDAYFEAEEVVVFGTPA